MDGNCQTSPQAAFLEDTKYVSGLSTILVATIQEAKDRISQIEYIFCSQIYPNFQSKSKSMQKLCSEAIEAAEASWKEKERDLLLQLAKLQSENQQCLGEIHSLKLEKETYADKSGYTKTRVSDLEEELNRKTKEVEEKGETQAYLERVIDSKTSLILDKEKSLKVLEEKNAQILKRETSLEVEVSRLKDELEKTIKKHKTLDSDYDHLLKETRVKHDEVEEGRKLQEQLLQQIELYNLERVKTGQEFDLLEKEKQHLLDKIRSLEEKNTVSFEGMELHRKLLEEIETKNSQLIAERKRKNDLLNSYKKVKSQYKFLCAKYGLTTENMLPRNKAADEMDGTERNLSPNVSNVKEVPTVTNLHGQVDNRKEENELSNYQSVEAIQKSNSPSPSSKSFIQPKMANCKSCPPAGSKRPGSFWRDTRSHQSRFGPDLHDDFLDTPLEKVKADTSKATKDEVNDLPDAPQDMDFDESDDETQDMKVVVSDILVPQKKQMVMPPNPGTSNYKFVEPVRKKAERENLKGIECKQCKKFYDAVLPNNIDGQDQNAKQSLRCEHHDGVSRHRYRYVPPCTPEGFWNIGFESEM